MMATIEMRRMRANCEYSGRYTDLVKLRRYLQLVLGKLLPVLQALHDAQQPVRALPVGQLARAVLEAILVVEHQRAQARLDREHDAPQLGALRCRARDRVSAQVNGRTGLAVAQVAVGAKVGQHLEEVPVALLGGEVDGGVTVAAHGVGGAALIEQQPAHFFEPGHGGVVQARRARGVQHRGGGAVVYENAADVEHQCLVVEARTQRARLEQAGGALCAGAVERARHDGRRAH